MSLLSGLSGLFGGGSSKRDEADSIIKDVGETCDNLFTSDEERKEMQYKLERLSALNRSTFVAGGRSAILYVVALVFLYQTIVRDWLGIVYGFDHLPPPVLDITKYAGHIFSLLTGVPVSF